ncbi:hypothetical protein [Photobacterium angustum]|nr:hypothetical protein [Photobacterium angustum]KJG53869.1 hypothetical protein UA34_06185 [Photobacterium angustum]
MHQILRLLYLSQSSDSTKIFRSEIESRYDSASTREAIGDFILGLDDLSSYETRQQIFKIKRSVDSIKSDIKSYKNILQIDDSCNIQDYNDAINNKRIEIRENISNKNNELSLASQFFSDDFTKNINEISQNIADITIKIKQLQEKKVYINSEISDCILFSKSLIFRLKSLKESKSTFSAIGAMSFTFCPSCYSSVKESNIDDCKCALCKNELPKHNLEEKYTEVLAELKYQQRQNENTIAKLKISFEKVTSELSQLNGLLRENESKLRNYSSSTNDRELVIEKYSNIISKLESELEEKIEQKNTFMRIDELVKEEEDKSKLLVNLEKKLKKNSINNKDRRFTVLETISNKAKKLLELDLGNECDFKEASKLSDEINFCKDEWSIGGRVVFSDSSNVIKKSSLQIAMLFCSLNDIKARLPGFMMLDFECGDLNESRSHRFQKNLVDTFADSKDFQIIITTSKVCKELNNDHYGIGEYYDVGQYIFPV